MGLRAGAPGVRRADPGPLDAWRAALEGSGSGGDVNGELGGALGMGVLGGMPVATLSVPPGVEVRADGTHRKRIVHPLESTCGLSAS